MIAPNSQRQAIRALHGIFVAMRQIASEGADLSTIARACDIAEVLPTLFDREEDLTDLFRQHILDLVGLNSAFGVALEYFDGKL